MGYVHAFIQALRRARVAMNCSPPRERTRALGPSPETGQAGGAPDQQHAPRALKQFLEGSF